MTTPSIPATTLFSKFNVTESDAIRVIDGSPYIKDIALGEMIELARPGVIKELIKRHIKAENINDFRVIRTVRQTSELGGRPPEVYYLSEADSLFIVSKSETAKGAMVLKRLIQFWLELRDKAHDFFSAEAEKIKVLDDRILSLRMELLKSRPVWSKIIRYRSIGLTNAEMSKLLDLSERSIRRNLKKMDECGFSCASKDYPVEYIRDGSDPARQLMLWA